MRIKNQIFVSHSSRDNVKVQRILASFNGTHVKPLTFESEVWQENNEPMALWVKREILRSKALFVILTRNLVSKRHTQNWVAFEIGIAAGSRREIPIYVITAENVNFPVPFLNHYFSYSPAWRTSQFKGVKRNDYEAQARFMLQHFITKPLRKLDRSPVTCPNCQTSYFCHGGEPVIKCPVCSSQVDRRIYEPTYGK